MKEIIVDAECMFHRCAHRLGGSGEAVWDGKTILELGRVVSQPVWKYRPDRVHIVWGGGRSARRVDLLPQYKDGRSDPPENLDVLTNSATGMFRNLACRVFMIPEKEADDVIYQLYYRVRDSDVIVVSDDEDFLQMVSIGAKVYRPVKRQFVQVTNFREIKGMEPELFLLGKAITGDKSDNISGVPGIGRKTFSQLLDKYPSVTNLESLCRAIFQTPKKGKRMLSVLESRQLIERNLELVDFSRELFSADDIAALDLGLNRRVMFLQDEIVETVSRFDNERDSLPGWVEPFRRLN